MSEIKLSNILVFTFLVRNIMLNMIDRQNSILHSGLNGKQYDFLSQLTLMCRSQFLSGPNDPFTGVAKDIGKHRYSCHTFITVAKLPL